MAVGVALREKSEIVRVPSRSERDSDSSTREIVDHRPFFSDANRIMQGRHDAARTQTYLLRRHRQRCMQNRRVWVERSEMCEVTLRHPNAGETMPVAESGAVDDERIFISGERIF